MRRAKDVPATMPNHVPSRRESTALLVATRAASILVHGLPMEPEQSSTMTSAASAAASLPSECDVTCTTAWTADVPRCRYGFWCTVALNVVTTRSPPSHSRDSLLSADSDDGKGQIVV